MNFKKIITIGLALGASALAAEAHGNPLVNKGRSGFARVANQDAKSHVIETRLTSRFVSNEKVQNVKSNKKRVHASRYGRGGFGFKHFSKR